LRRGRRSLVWRRFRLWIGGWEHDENANHDGVTTLMIFANGLLFAIAARRLAGKVDDLRERRENFNFSDVRRLKDFCYCFMY